MAATVLKMASARAGSMRATRCMPAPNRSTQSDPSGLTWAIGDISGLLSRKLLALILGNEIVAATLES